MWNWKLIYEDGEVASYCDLDKIIDTEGGEDNIFASMECYRQLPTKFAVWVSLIFKTKEAAQRYKEQRKGAGLPAKGYQRFRYTLCLVEIDAAKKRYRVIPATDYDSSDNELGESSILSDKDEPLVEGLKTEWASVRSKTTHSMIPAIFKRFLVQPG
ncbi:MAG TPA: hypothetical protein PLX02_03865 [Syntrophorhabdaceae bacterium]|nr:hypothetical protein [Syntrophorhabdaceae bacterium]HQM80737.1 hypothetical protein [Syntrophorhabdaceae bacterium]